MKTHKWALRVIAALAGFTLVICLTAPAKATELTEQLITEYVEDEAACYALAKAAGDDVSKARHLFNIRQHLDAYKFTIIHTIGYTEGYLAAVHYVTSTPEAILASRQHTKFCLEKS